MRKILKSFSLLAVFLGVLILAACKKDTTGIVGELSCETTRNSIEVTAEFEQNENLTSGAATASVKLYDEEEIYKSSKGLDVSNGISATAKFEALEFDTKYILKLFVSLNGVEEEIHSIEATTKNTGDTAETAIEISTVDQFLNITNDKEAYYKLVADIDLTDKASVRLSKSSDAFTGYFDGNGHKISNINLATDNEYAGLFGLAKDATFKNVTLENVTFDNKSTTVKTFGALVGYGENVTIENVTINKLSAEITKTNTSLSVYGGLIGVSTTTGNKKSEIKNCTVNESTFNFNEFRVTKDTNSAIGLFAGKLEGNSVVSDCGASANLTVKYKYSNPGVLNIGGFAGICNSSEFISNSYTIADIKVLRNTYSFQGINAGGFVGVNGSGDINLDGVFAKADITVIADVDADETKALDNKIATNTYVGGLVGKANRSSKGIKNSVYQALENGIKVVGKVDDDTKVYAGLVAGSIGSAVATEVYSLSELISLVDGMNKSEALIDAAKVSVLSEALQAKINE